MNDLQYLKKTIKIENILAYFGFNVFNTQKINYFIKSPFRQEKTPSFKINKIKNTWYDFGLGEGGSNLDLLIKLKNWSAKEAIKFLREFDGDNNNFLSLHPQNQNQNYSYDYENEKMGIEQKKEQKVMNILKEQNIKNKALIDYLEIRKISLEVAKKYLTEIYFKNNEKRYFALAWRNESGGVNWRNKYMKGCIGSNNYTFFSRNSENLAIFEGMFDFLSAVVYFCREPENDVIVLNSLANIKKIDFEKYEKINLFLDNDKAGEKAKNELIKKYKNKVKDYSKIYAGYKDFNEYLINK